MSELVTLDKLFAACDVNYLTANTSIGKVRFRDLNDEETAEYEQAPFDSKGNYSQAKGRGQRRRLLALTMVDGDGNLLFKAEADIMRAKQIRGRVLRELFVIARAHCGLDVTNEDRVKNSDETDDDA